MTEYDPNAESGFEDGDFEMTAIETPPPGSYLATVKDVEKTTIDMREGPTEFLRFTFVVPIKGEEPYVTDAIAATMDSKGMRAYGNGRMKLTRWVQALLGELPPISRDALVGAQGIVVLDLDASGFLKVVDVIARPKGA